MPAIGGLALWLGTLGGRVAMGLALLAALGALRAWDVSHQRSVGVAKERASVEAQGQKIDAKAQDARRRAEQRSADSLRGYYRD